MGLIQRECYEAVQDLNVWRRKGEHALHKPFLVLFELSRIALNVEGRLIRFKDLYEPLVEAAGFGPHLGVTCHPPPDAEGGAKTRTLETPSEGKNSHLTVSELPHCQPQDRAQIRRRNRDSIEVG